MPIGLDVKDHEFVTDNAIRYSCYYHVVFCTKYRRSVLNDDMQSLIKNVIYENQGAYGYKILQIETAPDHIHLVITIPPTTSISAMVGKIKRFLVGKVEAEYPSLQSRLPNLWTRATFVASSGHVTLGPINEFIRDQIGV